MSFAAPSRDCSAYAHFYDPEDHVDQHDNNNDDPDAPFNVCRYQPCPNRFNGIEFDWDNETYLQPTVNQFPDYLPLPIVGDTRYNTPQATRPPTRLPSPRSVSPMAGQGQLQQAPQAAPQAAPQQVAAPQNASAQDVLNGFNTLNGILAALTGRVNNIADLIADLTTQVQNVTATVGAQAVHAAQPANTATAASSRFVEKPEKYDGKGSDKARVFRNAFHIWSHSNPGIFGARDGNGLLIAGQWDDAKIIKSVLSFLTGDAAKWARPHIETLVQNGTVFGNSWPQFVAAFQAKFEPLNKIVEACKKLKEVKQGHQSFATFLSNWEQWAPQTGYSDTDLFVRMKESLSKDFLTRLSYFTPPPTNTTELVAYCKQIDASINDLKYSLAAASGSSSLSSAPVSSTGFRDPNAMDIDASRFDQQFTGLPRDPTIVKAHLQKVLKDKCPVCASADHRKDHHPADTRCSHCQKPGH